MFDSKGRGKKENRGKKCSYWYINDLCCITCACGAFGITFGASKRIALVVSSGTAGNTSGGISHEEICRIAG